MITVASDFSGVGALDQALIRLGIPYKKVFACDKDKFARQTYIHNYGEPDYFPDDVYDREIPSDPLDLYVTTPPCQSFSLSGKRLGEDDERGILFYNSHEFIQKNRPRYFVFENVKGLLSDDGGKTFQRWLDYLGGKSVNGNPVIFPHEESAPYHIYWKVLNAKDYNVPQNRERVFIVGIRDDADNDFNWPKPEPLTMMLKDVLEDEVDSKYQLTNKALEYLIRAKEYRGRLRVNIDNGFGVSTSITSNYHKGVHNQGETYVYSNSGIARNFEKRKIIPPLRSHDGCSHDNYVLIKSATKKGYEIAKEGDSINLSVPNSKTRRGRVGNQVSQTLDTACNQGVIQLNPSSNNKNKQDRSSHRIRKLTPRECFRLMDFPDSFTWPVSDSQAYKQAGNSVVVKMFELIIKNLITE